MNLATRRTSAALALAIALASACPAAAQYSPWAKYVEHKSGNVSKYTDLLGKHQPPKSAPHSLLGTKVVNFAVARLGQRLDRGECTDLVVAALATSRAKAGDFSNPTGYVWGRLLGANDASRPGDIIQFEGCEFRTSNSWYTMPHHTAIIRTAAGTRLGLLHQNAPVGGPVVEVTLDLAWKVRGDTKIYRPIPW